MTNTNLIPESVRQRLLEAEEARLARIINLRHALAGYPLGRPRD